MTQYDVYDGTLDPFSINSGTPDVYNDEGVYRLRFNANSDVMLAETNETGPWEFRFKKTGTISTFYLLFLCDDNYNSMSLTISNDYISLGDESYNEIAVYSNTLTNNVFYDVKVTRDGSTFDLYVNDTLIGSGTGTPTATPTQINLYMIGSTTKYVILDYIKVAGAEEEPPGLISATAMPSNFSVETPKIIIPKEELITTVEITGSADGELTDFPVEITIPYSDNIQEDYGDIRFYQGVTPLNYYILSKTDGITCTFLVKLPIIPASPSTISVKITSGGETKTTTSDPASVYRYYDTGETNNLSNYTTVDIYNTGINGSISYNATEKAYQIATTSGDSVFAKINDLDGETNLILRSNFKRTTNTENQQGGLIGRHTGINSYMGVRYVTVAVNRIDIFMGESDSLLGQQAYTVSQNAWYTAELTIAGTTMTGKIYDPSGNLVFSESGTVPEVSGSWGLVTGFYMGSANLFKNITARKTTSNLPIIGELQGWYNEDPSAFMPIIPPVAETDFSLDSPSIEISGLILFDWLDGTLSPWLSLWGTNSVSTAGFGYNCFFQTARAFNYEARASTPLEELSGTWEIKFKFNGTSARTFHFYPLANIPSGYDIQNFTGMSINNEGHVEFFYNGNTIDTSTVAAPGTTEHSIKISRNNSGETLFYYDDQLLIATSTPDATSSSMVIRTWSGLNYATTYVDFISFSPTPLSTSNTIPLESSFLVNTPAIITTAQLPLQSTYTSITPSIFAQKNVSIDIPVPESTYQQVLPEIRGGIGINPTTIIHTQTLSIPQIFYSYGISPQVIYSRYTMGIPKEQKQTSEITIFSRIIIKQIKEAIVTPIHK